MLELPVVDVACLRGSSGDRDATVAAIAGACRSTGFFYVVGHAVDPALERRLEHAAAAFFALPRAARERIAMAHGGRAWRGWFPLGGELTSGAPDRKEGIYFGEELDRDDPRVRAGVPLCGPNLFPAELPELREIVLSWIAAMTELGHVLLRGIALSLGLEPEYFERYTADPLVLLRIFHYPPATDAEGWGVGEHTDYGLLTIVKQDDVGGLEVRTPDGWIAAPPRPGAFVCNIGDMLDRMTAGWYRSTPHRVRNHGDRARLSVPFFFDPALTAEVRPVELGDDRRVPDDAHARWDNASVHAFDGNYGDYLLAKVSKVFPQLGRDVLP